MRLLTFDDLHNYEKRAIVEAIHLKHAALFLGTGLGKTIIALTIIDQLLKRNLIKGALIFATKKAVFNTWRQEAKKWKHTRYLNFSIIHGDAGRGASGYVKRKNLLLTKAHIYLINYEGIPWLVKTMDAYLRERILPFDLVIYDESTKMKHSTTQRFKNFKRYMPKFRYRFPMTGTPAPNGVHDLFGQIYTMDLGHSLGTTLTSFRKRFFTQIPKDNYAIYTPLPGSDKSIRKRIQDRVIYMKKEDYTKLPAITYNPILIDLPKRLRAQYEELETTFFIELQRAKVEAFSKTALSMKLRQFIQGKMYYKKGDKRHIVKVHDEKLQVIKEMVDTKQKGGTRILEGIGNAIIAYNFQYERDDLQSVFPTAPAIDGKTTDREAMRYITEWNAGVHGVLLYNPASDPHGLNLQSGGNQVVWYGQTWDLEKFIQLIDRVYRQGQERRVFVHSILFRDTIDVTMFNALKEKNMTQTRLLEALREHRQTATGGSPKGGR